MKTSVQKFITFCLAIAVFAVVPQYLAAQNRLIGELVVEKTSPDAYVWVNGEQSLGGRSVTSPSEIRTSAGATAKLLLPQTGSISFAPESKANLSFVNSSIAGDFLAGEITIETAPNTTINIFAPDGTITTPNRNQINIVKISIAGGASRVTALKGEAMFNTVLVSAGETYAPAAGATASSASGEGGVNPLLVLGVLGAVAGAVIIALSVSSGGDNPVVSPTR